MSKDHTHLVDWLKKLSYRLFRSLWQQSHNASLRLAQPSRLGRDITLEDRNAPNAFGLEQAVLWSLSDPLGPPLRGEHLSLDEKTLSTAGNASRFGHSALPFSGSLISTDFVGPDEKPTDSRPVESQSGLPVLRISPLDLTDKSTNVLDVDLFFSSTTGRLNEPSGTVQLPPLRSSGNTAGSLIGDGTAGLSLGSSWFAPASIGRATPASAETSADGQEPLLASFASLNSSPIAQDDSATTTEDTAVVIAVLANDSGSSLSVTDVETPSSGSVGINPDGTLTYKPFQDANGTEAFTYTITDGNGLSDTATVTVTVQPVDDAPTAHPDAYAVQADTLLTVAAPGVLGNDYRPDEETLTAVLEQGSAHGSLTLNSDGSFSYTPDPSFTGADQFTYRASDGNLSSEPATVQITVASNLPPVANIDIATTDENGVVTLDLLSNDTDPEQDLLTVTGVVLQPSNGTVFVGPDGIADYFPNDNAFPQNAGFGFYGTDWFVYEITDGQGNYSEASVYIDVVPIVNHGPEAQGDSYETPVDTPLDIQAPGVLSNDSDDDGNYLQAELMAGPSNGILAFAGDGSFNYTPHPGFIGVDTFLYAAYDGAVLSAPVFVAIAVGIQAAPENKLTIDVKKGENLVGKLEVTWAEGVILANFKSEVPQGKPTAVEAAKQFGAHHFNWYQIVTDSNRKAFDANQKELKEFPWVDQPPGGFSGIKEVGTNQVWADKLPWKYLEVKKPDAVNIASPRHWSANTESYWASMTDNPRYPDNDTYAKFKTWLVSIKEDGSLVQFHGGFE